jgi:solute carrier family 25 phosphate transporter 23/24/25/41
MYRREGLRGLFRGNGVSIMLASPFTALEFYFYDVFKNNLFSDTGPLTFNQRLISGGMAGLVATFITHPFDVIKTNVVTKNNAMKQLGGDCTKFIKTCPI